MPRKAPARGIDAAAFVLTKENRHELAEKFPRVDLDRTYEVFRDKALANGWLYSSWIAAFRNYIRNGKQYGGVEYKSAMINPAFDALIERARSLGFRMPHKSESAGAYRTALDVYDRQTAKQAAFRLGDLIKRVHK
jgi:hypothetical protein